MSFPHPLHLLKIALIAVMPTFLIGCSAVRGLELQSTNAFFSGSQEAQLGQQYSQQLDSELAFIEDSTVQAWIDEMGAKLVAESPQSDQQFRFRVTAEPQINAFAIPGGFCYINSGLILAAENEAQVAAVVGHEINHVTMRHGMRSIQRATGINLLATALSADPGTAQVANVVSQAGGVVAMRGFSREDEREADKYGVEAMYRAGYDPREAAKFFQILQRAEGSAKNGTFLDRIVATHPTTNERIENIKEQAAQYDLSRPLIVDTPRFREVQEIVRRYQDEKRP